MPMTRTVSLPHRRSTVRTRTCRLVTVLALCLMGTSGWVAEANAAAAVRARSAKATAKAPGKTTPTHGKSARVKARPTSASRSRAHAARASVIPSSRLPRARARRTQWLDAQTPRYKTDASGALVPDVRAAAAIIYNPENGQVLWEANSQDKRSIASITKVMTAAVVLEDDPDLTRVVVVDRADTFAANHTYLRPKDRVSID